MPDYQFFHKTLCSQQEAPIQLSNAALNAAEPYVDNCISTSPNPQVIMVVVMVMVFALLSTIHFILRAFKA